MTLPFSIDQFLGVFSSYNEAIWPLQIAAYLAGAAVVVLVALRHRMAGVVASAVLAAMWLVNGAGYHLAYFSAINPAAVLFGALFILQGLLIVWYGIVRRRVQFAARPVAWSWVGWAVIAYAMLVYPVLGQALGHVYPAAPVFGVAPCPTTIFTLGILLLARPAAPAWVFIVPLLWAAVGGSAAVLLSVREDFGLIAAGVAALVILVIGRAARPPRPTPLHVG